MFSVGVGVRDVLSDLPPVCTAPTIVMATRSWNLALEH